MSERRAVTNVIATRYARSDRAVKKQIPDELCAMTGWHRDCWAVQGTPCGRLLAANFGFL